MDMEFKEASTPTLTLDPFKESEKVNPVKAAEPEAMDDNVLSPEEQKRELKRKWLIFQKRLLKRSNQRTWEK